MIEKGSAPVKRRGITREFKLQVLREIAAGKSQAQAARDYQVTETAIYKWRREYAKYKDEAFSGHGPQSVSVRTLKRFDEPDSNQVATRIAALEPEQYTRAGAAIRHASATLMRQPAAQRLLLLLSDGKPNDVDVYEGRYGIEDMRHAVIEAKLQGIAPFCLTVDRHAAGYLPGVFGAKQYTLLTRPSMLPTALIDWIHRLVSAG